MLGDHLGQDGVATRAHVGRGDEQHVSPVVVELDGDRAHVDAGDARTLHGHGNAGGAHLAVAHVAHGELLFPAEHVAAVLHAAVQGAGVGHLAEIGRHGHALAHHVLLAQLNRVATQLRRQLVDGGFHGELALRGTEAAVRARRLHVRVHHVGVELERLKRAGIERDGLVTGQADRGPAVLAVGARIRQRGHPKRADAAVAVRA